MDQKQFDELVAKVGEQAALIIKAKMEAAQKEIDTKIEAALKSKSTPEEVKAMIDEVVKAADKAVRDEYTEILKKQGAEIGELKMQVKTHAENGKPLSIRKALMNAFQSDECQAQFAAIKKNGGKQDAAIKVAITMGDGNTIGSGSTQVSLTENTGIISPIRRRLERYMMSVSVGSIGSERALWIEETDEEGTPIFIAEAAGKVQVSSVWVEQTQPVKKIGVYAKVTTELMADLAQLVSFIQSSLIKRLNVKVEDELINGLGTGNTLKGAVEWASDFSAGDLANAVQAPNEFDVLTALALQVDVANGEPNAVYIHPSTWAKMKTLKDSQNKPIWKDYVIPGSGGAVEFEGMRIITSTAVAAGEFIGGDMSVLNVLIREELSIQIGLDGNDFTNNVKTILAEKRLVQFVSANDTPVLVYGVFTDAIADLLTTP